MGEVGAEALETESERKDKGGDSQMFDLSNWEAGCRFAEKPKQGFYFGEIVVWSLL